MPSNETRLRKLERQVKAAQLGAASRHYRGTSAIDFTVVTLPYQGDYGFQTTDSEIQVNCNGVIRAITTAAL